MAKRPTITNISSGYTSTTALNNNFEKLRDGFDNTLSLDGSTPNGMQADLDLNNNHIVNARSLVINGVDVFDALEAAKAAAAASAASSAVFAANSAASAVQSQASFDSFEAIYLGAGAANPTTDLNGDPLTLGDWYFNTVENAVRVYNGTTFVTGSTDPAQIQSEAIALAIALG